MIDHNPISGGTQWKNSNVKGAHMNGIKEPQTNQNCAPVANQSTGVKIEAKETETPRKKWGGKEAIDLIGINFGTLTVLSRAENRGGRPHWLCKCECGNIISINGGSLRRGYTKSCGCMKSKTISEKNSKHRLRKNPVYSVWQGILRRCDNHSHISYHRYGGRGIKVCDEWRDLKVFIRWAEENGYEKGLEIDRIDNDGDYCPENCRFVTHVFNCHNKNSPLAGNKSGYTGVYYRDDRSKFMSTIAVSSLITKYLGHFKTAKDAAIARDQYIIDNNLPHRLQVLSRT